MTKQEVIQKFADNRKLLFDYGSEEVYVSHPILDVLCSQFGNIIILLTDGKVKKVNKVLSPNGYIKICLNLTKHVGDVKSFAKPYPKSYLAHRLILETFVDKPDDVIDWVVDHKDGVRSNNRIENLQWLSRIDNLVKRDGGLLHRETFVYDLDAKTVTGYKSRMDVAKAYNIEPSKLSIMITKGKRFGRLFFSSLDNIDFRDIEQFSGEYRMMSYKDRSMMGKNQVRRCSLTDISSGLVTKFDRLADLADYLHVKRSYVSVLVRTGKPYNGRWIVKKEV